MYLRGEIDLTTAPILEEELSWLTQSPHMHVRIDFGGVTVLDSAGIKVLVNAATELKSNHGRVTLVRLNPQIKSLAEIVHLTEIITVEDTGGAVTAIQH